MRNVLMALCLVFVTGCEGCNEEERSPVGVAGVQNPWPHTAVRSLLVSEDLDTCERASLRAAAAFWKELLRRPVIWLVSTPADDYRLSIPPKGVVSVTSDPVSRPETIQEYHAILTSSGKMHSGEIRVGGCDVFAATHEVGHMLGLGHSSAGLMRAEKSNDWRVHPDDIEALR